MANVTRYVGDMVSFDALDQNIVSHTWKINGVIESVNASFEKVFDTTGLYIVRHEGVNECNELCTVVEKTLEVIERPPPSEMGGLGVMILVLGLGVGLIYSTIKK